MDLEALARRSLEAGISEAQRQQMAEVHRAEIERQAGLAPVLLAALETVAGAPEFSAHFPGRIVDVVTDAINLAKKGNP